MASYKQVSFKEYVGVNISNGSTCWTGELQGMTEEQAARLAGQREILPEFLLKATDCSVTTFTVC